MHIHLPHEPVYRLGAVFKTESSEITLLSECIRKITRCHTGKMLLELYRILLNDRIPHLIYPLEAARIHGPNKHLCVLLMPIGIGRHPRTSDEIHDAILPVLTALSGLHSRGWVHRDIRWPNILLSGGEWFLFDLEWADKVDAGLPPSKSAFIPPELRDCEDAVWGTSADMWQVGQLLDGLDGSATLGQMHMT
jgi:serine/threonine protein kinase